MPTRLRRAYGTGYLHFITTSCYQRLPLLGSPAPRDLFLRVLEETRRRYGFIVVGYVVMPEHVHLLIGEPEKGTFSTVMQVLKQRFAREFLRCLPDSASADLAVKEGHVWQRRFYDFVVWNPQKRVEKLRYMHRNPVKRGLVAEPGQWKWSSYRFYAYGEPAPVLLNEKKPVVLKWRGVEIAQGGVRYDRVEDSAQIPPLQNAQGWDWHHWPQPLASDAPKSPASSAPALSGAKGLGG